MPLTSPETFTETGRGARPARLLGIHMRAKLAGDVSLVRTRRVRECSKHEVKVHVYLVERLCHPQTVNQPEDLILYV